MTLPALHFDYDRQAWLVDGVYQPCNHPERMQCRCYGKLHAGERPSDADLARLLAQLEEDESRVSPVATVRY